MGNVIMFKRKQLEGGLHTVYCQRKEHIWSEPVPFKWVWEFGEQYLFLRQIH